MRKCNIFKFQFIQRNYVGSKTDYYESEDYVKSFDQEFSKPPVHNVIFITIIVPNENLN